MRNMYKAHNRAIEFQFKYLILRSKELSIDISNHLQIVSQYLNLKKDPKPLLNEVYDSLIDDARKMKTLAMYLDLIDGYIQNSFIKITSLQTEEEIDKYYKND